MSGSVGLIADQWSRCTVFHQCLTALYGRLPPNTVVDWRLGADRGRSRNTLVAASLERGSEWMLFLDDDHSFPETILDTLLSRNQPVVASLYLQRSDPFLPIAYAEKDERGNYWPLDLTKCPEHGLVTVVGAGTGGMLIKSEVFRQIPEPWFVHTTQQSEDLYFCDRLAEAGIPLYVDLDARLGHVAPMAIYPDWEEGQWTAGMAVSPTMKVLLPIVMPEETSAPDWTASPSDPESFATESSEASAEGNGAETGAEATRVEMWPDDQGRWHARGVTEDGLIVDKQDAVFNREAAETKARKRWPGLDIYEVADENSDSTWAGIGPSRRRFQRSTG